MTATKYEVFVECRTCDWRKVSAPTVKANLRSIGVVIEQHLREHLHANKTHQGIMPSPRKATR